MYVSSDEVRNTVNMIQYRQNRDRLNHGNSLHDQSIQCRFFLINYDRYRYVRKAQRSTAEVQSRAEVRRQFEPQFTCFETLFSQSNKWLSVLEPYQTDNPTDMTPIRATRFSLVVNVNALQSTRLKWVGVCYRDLACLHICPSKPDIMNMAR